ncbi:MAG: hypothetical protein KGI52_10905 [Burkholderiales bacterium]|nr:hypothetical protein [Burkholderiales bacterium]
MAGAETGATPMSAQLIKYEAACRALAECKAIDEVKAWADKAAAMQAYGKMAKDKTLEVDAAEIRIRAERRLGEMLSQQKAEGGLNTGVAGAAGPGRGNKNVVVADDRVSKAPKLADAGISKDLSSRAQKLAAVPEAEFEEALAEKREIQQREGERVTARLLEKGEKHLKKQALAASEDQELADAMGADPVELLNDLQRENEALLAQIKTLTAEDTKAELHKMILQRDHAVREQEVAMDRAHKEQRLHAQKHRALMRCGKAVGEDDPTKIAATVEAFVRAHGGMPFKVVA